MPPRVTFATSINGGPAALAGDLTVPTFHVRPGQRLVMSVAATVPGHAKVTTLWLGICRDRNDLNSHGYVDMNPTLASAHRPLLAGRHTFGFGWRLPKPRLAATVYLCAYWSGDAAAAATRNIAALAPS